VKPLIDTVIHLLAYNDLTGEFVWKNRQTNRVAIGSVAGSKNRKDGYIRIGISKKIYAAHRLAFIFMTGDWPPEDVDHIDGNKANNSWNNLRLASDQVNAQNLRRAKSSNKSSGLLGSFFNKSVNRWMSMIMIDGKNKYLGLFDTPEQAHEAYLTQKRKHHLGCTI